jgi:hypothetical protein
MHKVPNGDSENAVCDQYKVDSLEEKVRGGLRGSPLINSYIRADLTSWRALTLDGKH